MSSISVFNPSLSMYQAPETSRIDSAKPRANPLDQSAGDDVLWGSGQLPVNGHPMPGQPAQHRIDNDNPMFNALDHTAGDDAEVFDPATQAWQPTQAAGNGRYSALGDPYREAIDFEIKADDMGGWQQA
ncbi:hypothetical protein [Pseudomonas sp. AU10]|uniref:hypothetical protein n=1 Tax=Pseudomonas sp. AU10 TaxID=882697 RepID=UPI0021E20C75|nr:hypothetical protein [Pseudomonas sp. AU10]MCV2227730.1 hypothetical protein [Pseudomonas sp. AU10]